MSEPVTTKTAGSSKLYPRNLTLYVEILSHISQGKFQAQIARVLNIDKSLVSYYVKKGIALDHIRDEVRDVIRVLNLTQPGEKFLDQYSKLNNPSVPPIRLENMRFKASIIEMPSTPVNWGNVEMKNWRQHNFRVDNVKVKVNLGKNPTIEFIITPMDGNDPWKLYADAVYDCIMVLARLEYYYKMKIGRPEPSSGAEWVVYDPIAKESCKYNGQINYHGFAKVNASKPRRIGEFEFHDPRALIDYLRMPATVSEIEKTCNLILRTIRTNSPT